MVDTNFSAFAQEVHKNAVEHGWWDEPRTVPEILMLCVSELSEALEEYRNDMPMMYRNCLEAVEHGYENPVCDPESLEDCTQYLHQNDCGYRASKPEGLAVELADCIIRILDYCAYAEIDIDAVIRIKHEYNKSRPYRHGGKKC